MQIFVDSPDIREIETWFRYGVIDGVTTNPTLMFKGGVENVELRVKGIAELIDPLPLSVEVTTNDLEEMREQGKRLASWAANIVVKIPVINASGQPCVGVVHDLVEEGIKVNVTAILSFGQVVLAAKAGAAYASIFGGRIADEGHDPAVVIRMAVDWIDRWKYSTRVLAGSIRGVLDIQSAAAAGAHIVTIPPELLCKMIDHKYSRETVKSFVQDAEKVLGRISSR